jgi:Zn-dependent protease with chaperone function
LNTFPTTNRAVQLQLTCLKCGTKTPEELEFCLNCRLRLTPKTRYDLNPNDFAYPPDLSAIETIKVTGALPYVVKRLALGDFENNLRSKLRAHAHKAVYPSPLDVLVRQCATLLSIEFVPETFILQSGQPNAFTFGSEEQAYIVVDSSLLTVLTPRELMMVIAHELGHVKSGHIMYHTLAEILGSGISLSASVLGLDVLSIPLRFALLSWHRESEVTADRAGLLAVKDIGVMKSLLPKLASGSATTIIEQLNPQKHDAGMLESIEELFRTHPIDSRRLRLAEEFWQSEEFRSARRKIELHQRLLKGLVPVCRYCGEGKPAKDMFCPKCGRCQI